jgi:hypothetical protein
MLGVSVSVELSSDEALVLFDLLTRYSESDRLEIVDQAEHGRSGTCAPTSKEIWPNRLTPPTATYLRRLVSGYATLRPRAVSPAPWQEPG